MGSATLQSLGDKSQVTISKPSAAMLTGRVFAFTEIMGSGAIVLREMGSGAFLFTKYVSWSRRSEDGGGQRKAPDPFILEAELPSNLTWEFGFQVTSW